MNKYLWEILWYYANFCISSNFDPLILASLDFSLLFNYCCDILNDFSPRSFYICWLKFFSKVESFLPYLFISVWTLRYLFYSIGYGQILSFILLLKINGRTAFQLHICVVNYWSNSSMLDIWVVIWYYLWCLICRWHHPYGRKWRGTKKPLDESERGELKSWLKAQHSENEDHGIWSHHFMANRWGNSGNSVRFYFLGSKITADGDSSHEIKRCLLLGRKVTTNLDSIFKSRDITLPTKVRFS